MELERWYCLKISRKMWPCVGSSINSAARGWHIMLSNKQGGGFPICAFSSLKENGCNYEQYIFWFQVYLQHQIAFPRCLNPWNWCPAYSQCFVKAKSENEDQHLVGCSILQRVMKFSVFQTYRRLIKNPSKTKGMHLPQCAYWHPGVILLLDDFSYSLLQVTQMHTVDVEFIVSSFPGWSHL